MKTTFYAIAFLILLLIQSLTITPAKSQTQNQEHIHSFMQQVIDSFPGVSGLYVIAVQNDKILFSESVGYAQVENKTRFTPETEMYIASNTKAFTGLAMAKLIRDGRISENDPITKYIDRQYFPDSIDANHIYIHDLPAHTHGLSNDAMTFRTAFAGNAPDSILPSLLKFTSYRFHPHSKKFSYSNFSYLICGMVIQKVTGISWRDYLLDSLLIPAGMKKTTPYISKINKAELVEPYLFNKRGKKLPIEKLDNTMHAAGGVVSTGDDMAKWLLLFMNEGKIKDQVLLNPEYIKLAKTMLVDDEGEMGPFIRKGYAYGWLIGEFNHEKLYFHFGNYTGMGSMMSFMPDKDLAVFAFTNEGAAGIYLAALVSTYVYDELLNKENKNEIAKAVMGYVRRTYANYKSQSLQVATPSSLPFKNQDLYMSEAYGRLYIHERNDTVFMNLGNLTTPVYEGDTANHYILQWIPGDPEKIEYLKIPEGEIIKYENYTTFYKR